MSSETRPSSSVSRNLLWATTQVSTSHVEIWEFTCSGLCEFYFDLFFSKIIGQINCIFYRACDIFNFLRPGHLKEVNKLWPWRARNIFKRLAISLSLCLFLGSSILNLWPMSCSISTRVINWLEQRLGSTSRRTMLSHRPKSTMQVQIW